MERRTFIKSAMTLGAATALHVSGAPLVHGAEQNTATPAPTHALTPECIARIRNYNPQMHYRSVGLTGIDVSALGFGMLRLPTLADGKTVNAPLTIAMVHRAIDLGLNYIDTAHVYMGGQSEEVTGRALAGGKRDHVYLTSKAPWWIMQKPEDFERIFDLSRKRLQTDVIDFYHIHMVMHRAWKEKIIPFKLIDKIEKLKQDGKIRFSGFSFHDNVTLFKKAVDANPQWNFCLIQQNYLDTEHEAGVVGLKYAAARGLGVSIMEPLRNGFLVTPPKHVKAVFDAAPRQRPSVEWAFDYLWNMPEVSVVVSGMSAMQHVEDNIAYAKRSSVGMLSVDDITVLGKVAQAYRASPGSVPCTGCYHCIPCPKNVAIGYLLNMVYNQYKADGNKQRAQHLMQNSMSPTLRGDKASVCDGCGQCLPKCPQGIDIPAALRRVRDELET